MTDRSYPKNFISILPKQHLGYLPVPQGDSQFSLGNYLIAITFKSQIVGTKFVILPTPVQKKGV